MIEEVSAPEPSPDTKLYWAAVDAIESANLSAIEHLVLLSFLDVSVSRTEVCHFILDQVSRAVEKNASVEEALRSVKRDLVILGRKCNREDPVPPYVNAALHEREQNRCCASGWEDDVQATYIVTPSAFSDSDLRPGGSLRPLLEATISAELADKYFTEPGTCAHLTNLWLMSPSVRYAFRAGHITMARSDFGNLNWSIEARFPELPVAGLQDNRFYAQPSTPDGSRLPLPDVSLLKVQRAVSLALHYLPLEDQIRRGWAPVKNGERRIGTIGKKLLRGLFLILPKYFRLVVYRQILKAVDRWVPQEDPAFKFLPFGLCLKNGPRVTRNEGNTLQIIEKYTSITAPRLIDITVDDKKENGFLLMTTVPGIPAENVFYRLTYEERHQLANDVGKCVAQYRRIPNRNNYLLCNTMGGLITDHRIDKPCGPYHSKADFLDSLTEGIEEFREESVISSLYKKDHEIVFTHSDLHTSNLLLENGRLSGIVDWEHAGFKPEYWDYTRAIWAYKSDQKLCYEYSLAFDKSYAEELKGERRLWWLKPVF